MPWILLTNKKKRRRRDFELNITHIGREMFRYLQHKMKGGGKGGGISD